MNRPLTLFVSSLLVLASADAQLFQARLVSSAYGWQRIDTVGQSVNHLFGFQSVQMTLGGRSVSVRTYLQGFNDFTGPNANAGRVRLYNLSVRVRDLFGMADAEAGRFFVFSTAGLGLIDGASVTVRPGFAGMSVKAFYGILAPSERSFTLNGSDNALGGARMSATLVDGLTASLSYAHKQYAQASYRGVRADSLFNPYVIEFRPSSRIESIVSGDARYDAEGLGDLYVRYDYDTETSETSRLNAHARVHLLDGLALTGEYLQREPRVSYQSIFSVFTLSTVKDVSGGVEYGFMSRWNLVARFGSISYGDESAQRITVGVNGPHVSASFAKNISDRQNLDAASLSAGYPLMENTVTPTLLLSYAHYKLDEKAPVNDALGIAGGVVVRPLELLTVDAQLQWLNNKVYANDVRLFLRASYLLSSRLNLF